MIDDIRRENLSALVAELGSVISLANRLERSESQVSQWINGSAHSETGRKRGMRPESARYIEEKCGKNPGWLDIDHSAVPQPTIQALTVKMFAITCTKCGKVMHQSFIELETNDTIPCPSCGVDLVVSDYYGVPELETILKSLGGAGFSLRKR